MWVKWKVVVYQRKNISFYEFTRLTSYLFPKSPSRISRDLTDEISKEQITFGAMSAADVRVGGWNAGKRHKGSSCASVIDKSLLVLRPPFAHGVLRTYDKVWCENRKRLWPTEASTAVYCAQFAFNPEIPIKPVTGPHRALYTMQSSASSFITCKNAAKENVHLIHRSHTSQQLHETKCQTASMREHNRSMIHDAPR